MADQAWQLLKLYLDRLGSRDGHVYYRCVASKLLSAGAALPTWLVNDYKVRRHAPIISSLLLIVAVIVFGLKDVRAHCYCASLVRTLFIGHARATSFSSARTDSKTQQNIERMTFALTWYANIFVGCSVTPTFFSADHFLF